MQTIDSIRRTSELSKVLKQHGFTDDSLQAVDQANQSTESTSLETDFSSEQNSAPILQKMANLERSKHLLSSRLDSMQQAHNATQSQLKQVLARLDSAEAKLRVFRNQPAQSAEPVAVPAQGPTTQPVQAEQSAPITQPTVDSGNHPRQAQESDAYSIENVFYCGTK